MTEFSGVWAYNPRLGFQCEEHFVRFAPLRRSRSDTVSSHNDFKPQTSYLTNTMFDLWPGSCFSERPVRGPPDEYRPARFFLTRQAMHTGYFAVFPFLDSLETNSQRTCGSTILAKH